MTVKNQGESLGVKIRKKLTVQIIIECLITVPEKKQLLQSHERTLGLHHKYNHVQIESCPAASEYPPIYGWYHCAKKNAQDRYPFPEKE